MTETVTADVMEPLRRLDRDLKEAAKLLGKQEVRYLVDSYYQTQEMRISTGHRILSCHQIPDEEPETDASETNGETEPAAEPDEKSTSQQRLRQIVRAEPHNLLNWQYENTRRLEDNIKRAMGVFTDDYTVGVWLKSITGIGPVISAGLLAHLDITRAPFAGHFWSFAGLNPAVKWEKGEKRPWNATLKTLVAFKLGESFVKVQNNKKDFYGHIFAARRIEEEERNNAGRNKDEAAHILEIKNIGKKTEAYKAYIAGRFPPAHLHARARRYTAKIFLAHLHHVMHCDWHGRPPAVPYAFEHLKHDPAHYIQTPNWPLSENMQAKGLREMKE